MEVDALATEIAKEKKNGVSSPFVLVDFSSYLPGWAMDTPDDESSSEEEGFESKVRKKVVKLAGAWGYNQPKAKRLNSLRPKGRTAAKGHSTDTQFLRLLRDRCQLHLLWFF